MQNNPITDIESETSYLDPETGGSPFSLTKEIRKPRLRLGFTLSN
jgi:hypothetical protein